jgi:hypothetical protein
LIEQPSCGADERVAASILLVTRLFTDQHDSGPVGALAHDSLCGVLP